MGSAEVDTREESSAPTATYRLSRHCVLVTCGPDEAMIKHGSRSRLSVVLRDDERAGALAAVLHRFREGASVDELLSEGVISPRLRGAVEGVMGDLVDAGMLVPVDDSPDRSYIDLRFDSATADELAATNVVVFGEGELASRVTAEIANAVGCVMRADDEASYVSALSVDRHVPCLSIVALDRYSPMTLRSIDEVARQADVMWVPAFIDGSLARVGPLIMPKEGPCIGEVEVQLDAGVIHRAEHDVFVGSTEASAALPPGVAALVSGWIVVSTISSVASGAGPLRGTSIVLDLESGSVDTVSILKLPRCPVCRRPPYRHVFQ